MSKNIQTLEYAMQFAMAHRPKIGGFPYMAECLRSSGVRHNIWTLPACQSVYLMEDGAVVSQMKPLETSMVDIPLFNEQALIRAIRADQAGQTIFPEFLLSTWEAGVVSYDVDFEQRNVTYYGMDGQSYREDYPKVSVEFENM